MMIPLLMIIILAVVSLVIVIIWMMSNLHQNFGKAIAIICLTMIIGFALLPVLGRWIG